ncbi:hypothetical protein BXY82_1488 [Gelidibacter sediminis]|uniref:Uncharacterized protein n=1 Tax=Gelidibacter sediminis TaxID=1608710 RepID=A0A4R7PWZ7_9FLAO|nr:hypothetical protein [Gelidibacter sediminis]TDU39464.1 hypothetical protein BXY82_1488 [Gelidibacter sediminis]
MNTYEIHKYAYSDKNTEELQFNLAFYKSRLELLMQDLEFFKHLLSSHIFDSKTPNLFETIEKFKTQIDQHTKVMLTLTTEVEKQFKEVQLKVECDELSCDNYFLKQYHDTELEVVKFLSQAGQLKSEMMEYTKGLIL